MSKKIRFHLVIDGVPVRNVEQLRKNFNLQEIMALHERGVLSRWLDAHEQVEILQKINKSKQGSFEEVAKGIIAALEVNAEENQIISTLDDIEYMRSRKVMLDNFNKNNIRLNSAITELYHGEYNAILENLENITNAANIHFLMKATTRLTRDYSPLLMLDSDRLYNHLKKHSPLTLLAFLCDKENINTRLFFDQKPERYEDFYSYTQNFFHHSGNSSIGALHKKHGVDHFSNTVTMFFISGNQLKNVDRTINEMNDGGVNSIMGRTLCDVVAASLFETATNEENTEPFNIAPNLKYISGMKCFVGTTDHYWKDLVDRDRRVLLVHLPPRTYARSAGEKGQEVSSETLKSAPFPVLNGLDYKSNNASETIAYIEID